jgi:hypothetical protein
MTKLRDLLQIRSSPGYIVGLAVLYCVGSSAEIGEAIA